jgi:hypothetical protein
VEFFNKEQQIGTRNCRRWRDLEEEQEKDQAGGGQWLQWLSPHKGNFQMTEEVLLKDFLLRRKKKHKNKNKGCCIKDCVTSTDRNPSRIWWDKPLW